MNCNSLLYAIDFFYISSMLISMTDCPTVVFFNEDQMVLCRIPIYITSRGQNGSHNKSSDLMLSDVILLIIHQSANILSHI